MRTLFRRAVAKPRALATITACSLLLAPLTASAATASDQAVRLPGSSVPGIQPGDRVGDLDPGRTVNIQLGLQLRDTAALDQLSVSEASAMVAATTGMPRRQVYARALALAGKRPRAERE